MMMMVDNDGWWFGGCWCIGGCGFVSCCIGSLYVPPRPLYHRHHNFVVFAISSLYWHFVCWELGLNLVNLWTLGCWQRWGWGWRNADNNEERCSCLDPVSGIRQRGEVSKERLMISSGNFLVAAPPLHLIKSTPNRGAQTRPKRETLHCPKHTLSLADSRKFV